MVLPSHLVSCTASDAAGLDLGHGTIFFFHGTLRSIIGAEFHGRRLRRVYARGVSR